MFKGTDFQPPSRSITLTTDALLIGCGAHTKGLSTRGLWSNDDKSKHINYLELKTVLLAIHSFLRILRGRTVAIGCDNTTAVSYVNKQGGTLSRSLCHLAIDIWELCIRNDIQPIATHVPETDNIVES